jgi:hypothetical protein
MFMQMTQDSYFEAYRSLKLGSDSRGVLVVELHSNGGPLALTAPDHTNFVDAFYRISPGTEGKISAPMRHER